MSRSQHGSSSADRNDPSRTSINVKLPNPADSTRSQSPGSRYSRSPAFMYTSGLPPPRDGLTCQSVIQPLPTPASSAKFSDGGSVPQGSPSTFIKQAQAERQLVHQASALIIERAWIQYRNQQMFRLLKHAVCAAESSLSPEILRKVCPKEAAFLNDKTVQVRIRFRFGGVDFPPMIFFKIYLHTEGRGVKYMSGKKMIRPSTDAAEDSLRLMGNRSFYDQLLRDTIHHKQYKITDEVDITTLKDYMQYLSNIDEMPARMGGRENLWRKLTLDALPRYTVFYDVVDYLYSKRMSSKLQEVVPQLSLKPVTQAIQLRHMDIITSTSPPIPWPTYSKHTTPTLVSSRRSRRAMLRAMKMQQAYQRNISQGMTDSAGLPMPSNYNMEEGEDWEHEADRLYEWTQELSFDDITATPRLKT